MRAVQGALDQVQRLAAGHRLRVNDDGVVRDTGCAATLADADRAAAMERDRERAREAARASVHEVLRAAVDIDDALASVLLAAARRRHRQPRHATLDEAWRAGAALPGIGLPRHHRGAVRRRDLVACALTPAEREEAARTMPAVLGRLDGLPSAVRDEANRTVMARERQRLQRLLPGLQAAVDRAASALARPRRRGGRRPRAADPDRPGRAGRGDHGPGGDRRTGHDARAGTARDDDCSRSAPAAGG